MATELCEECGTPLARSCPKCGSALSSSAKFCPYREMEMRFWLEQAEAIMAALP